MRLCSNSDSSSLGDDKPVKIFSAATFFGSTGPSYTFALIIAVDGAIASVGLGSFGDMVDGDGDVKMMHALGRRLTSSGLLLLSVPGGGDAVVFNTERRYGNILWPRLVAHFEVVDDEGALGTGANPAWLLKHKG